MENKIFNFLQDLLLTHGLRLYHWVTFARKGTLHVEIFIEKANAMEQYAQFTGKKFIELETMLASQERVTIEDCEQINNDVLNFVEKEDPDFSIHIQVSSAGMFRRIKHPVEFLFLHHYLMRVKMQNGSLVGGDRGFVVDLYNPQNFEYPLALMSFANEVSSTIENENENQKKNMNYSLVQEKWGIDLETESIDWQLVFVSFPIHEKWEEKWQSLYDLLMRFCQEKVLKIFAQRKEEELNNIWQEFIEGSELQKKSKGKFLITQGRKLVWNLLAWPKIKEIHLDFIIDKK